MEIKNQLKTAREIEQGMGIRRSSIYRMQKLGLVPSYRVGPKLTGIRFLESEILVALRTPAVSEAAAKIP